uniref:Uncharacterized protein n=1 Tax=Arundo donax TaxID=35708 RepID=A0A0A9CUY9_ARUDO
MAPPSRRYRSTRVRPASEFSGTASGAATSLAPASTRTSTASCTSPPSTPRKRPGRVGGHGGPDVGDHRCVPGAPGDTG